MVNVSDEYRAQIAKNIRQTAVYGTVTLNDGTEVELSNDNIVNGSLTITDQMTDGKFCLGSVYSRHLTMKMSGFSDTDTRFLSNAVIELYFRVIYTDDNGDEAYADCPLGFFYVDGSQTKRKFDVVTITASDAMQNFDIACTTTFTDATPTTIIGAACNACGVNAGAISSNLADLPNSTVTLNITTDTLAQAQTWRDILMWLGDIMGAFARINRYNRLEFVGIQPEKLSSGVIVPDLTIVGDLRYNTSFSDTTITVEKITMSRNGNIAKSTYTVISNNKHYMFATMELDENPLLADKTDDDVKTMLNDLLTYVFEARHRPYEFTFNGDPSIEVGDWIRITGGAIDVNLSNSSGGYATGIVTYSKWSMRGEHTIKCVSSTDNVRPAVSTASSDSSTDTETDTDTDTAAVSLATAAETSSDEESGIEAQADDDDDTSTETTEYTMSKSKSQTEKRIDGLLRNGTAKIAQYLHTTDTAAYVNTTASGIYVATADDAGHNSGAMAGAVDFSNGITLVSSGSNSCTYSATGNCVLYMSASAEDTGSFSFGWHSIPYSSNRINFYGDNTSGGHLGIQANNAFSFSMNNNVIAWSSLLENFQTIAAAQSYDTTTELHSFTISTSDSGKLRFQENADGTHTLYFDDEEVTGGGSTSVDSYTTAIAFNSGGFDLSFNYGGTVYTNAFTVTEDSSGNITSIKNETAGREITITYADE